MIEYFLHNSDVSTGELFYNNGQSINGVISILNNDVLSNQISANGQTLLETTPIVSVVGQQNIILNSGQFFLSGNSLRSQTGFLNLDLSNPNIKYDLNLTGDRSYFSAEDNANMILGFSGNYTGGQIFFNGIKLTSGESYIEGPNGEFQWLDSDALSTGFLFSVPNRDFLRSTGSYDIVGVYFNEGSSLGYLNGVKIDDSSILESSSILTGIIQTGLDPSVEFLISQSSETIFF